MADERFFTARDPQSLSSICTLIDGQLLFGDMDEQIHATAPLHAANKGHVSFIKKRTDLSALPASSHAVILTTEQLAEDVKGAAAVITVQNPRAAFALVSAALIDENHSLTDNRAAASIDASAHVDDTAIISPFCVIGAHAVIGAGTVLEAGVQVGAGVEIGRNCHIGSHVHLQTCLIGSKISIGAHTVIGKAGFGFEMTENGAVHMPHLGRVIIGDGVSIGANCTIDRGVMDDTKLSDNVMIDNLVHIAHNVEIGARTIILAQTGVAGSVKIGSDCIVAAQVGVKDHIEIASKSVILSRSAVTKSLLEPGVYAGFPAQLSKTEWREQAQLRKMAKAKNDKGRSDD